MRATACSYDIGNATIPAYSSVAAHEGTRVASWDMKSLSAITPADSFTVMAICPTTSGNVIEIVCAASYIICFAISGASSETICDTSLATKAPVPGRVAMTTAICKISPAKDNVCNQRAHSAVIRFRSVCVTAI